MLSVILVVESYTNLSQAHRLQELQHEMEQANDEYILAVNRASTFCYNPYLVSPLHATMFFTLENLHKKVSEALRNMLDTHDMLNEPD